MPNVPVTSAGFSKLSQPFERMKLADLSIGLSIWRSIKGGIIGAGDEIVKVKAGPERVTVTEINALLYLPGHPASGLERALRARPAPE